MCFFFLKYFASILYIDFARTVNNDGGISLIGEDVFFHILAFHDKKNKMKL